MASQLPSPIGVTAAPSGVFYIASALATAQGWSATVDAAQGYPSFGVDVGDGLHVPPAQSETFHYGPLFAHPTQQEWAYWSDAVSAAALAATAGLPAPQALDSTWAGATSAQAVVASPV